MCLNRIKNIFRLKFLSVRQLVDAFGNPFIGILVFVTVVFAIIDVWTPKVYDRDYSTAVMIVVMVTVSVVLKFVQEYRISSIPLKKNRFSLCHWHII